MKGTTDTLALAPPLARPADYLALIRPRVAVMVLVTVLMGGLLAADSAVPSAELVHAVLATGLVTAAASILNQWFERRTDMLMHRTANRPLPAGRLRSRDVLALGVALAVGGLAYMLLAVPQPLAAGVTAFTLVSYVGLYTPLKRVTTLNTLVGAVPGAMPPVIGWVAVRGRIDAGAVLLFLILFVWQVPHFLAIAWMYRDDYARAGLKMLSVGDARARRTAHQMLLYGLALVPVSLTPAQIGMGGPAYAFGAALLGGYFLWPIARFQGDRSTPAARRVLRASLVYLPGVYGLLLIAKFAA
ncbi:MAG TPA: heme o synthase [Gemmataceae bacterium]|jgi:protoheme IX farnesyltransferase